MVDLPKLIPRRWIGPRRNQVTQGDHNHIVGDAKTGYISAPLFNGQAPVDTDELVEILENYGLDGSDFVGGGGGGGSFTRSSFTITTSSLASNAVENGTKVVTAAYRLMTIDVDRACRVRLYKNSTKRTSDASRPIGTDPDISIDHGLIFEYVSAGGIAAMLSPLVDGFVPVSEGTTVYYAIQNLSGGTSTVAVIFDYLRTE